MGAHKKNGNDPEVEQDFEIERIIKHERYNKKPYRNSYDIALLKLSTPAQLNKRVALACLPETSTELPIDDLSKKCWITGKELSIFAFGNKQLPFLYLAHFFDIPPQHISRMGDASIRRYKSQSTHAGTGASGL